MPVASTVVCCRRPDPLVRHALVVAAALASGLVVGCGGSSAAPPAATPVEAAATARARADGPSAARASAAPGAAERTAGDRSAEPGPLAVQDEANHIASGLDELEEEAEEERREEERKDRKRMEDLLGGGGLGTRGWGSLGGIGSGGLGGGGSGYGSSGGGGTGYGGLGRGLGGGGRGVPKPLKPPPEPKIVASKPVVTGPALPGMVQRLLWARRHRFVDCYERAAQHNPALKGRVALRFRIKADGSVDQVSTAGSSLASPPARSCIVSLVQKMRFGAQRGPSQVSGNLDFSPPSKP